MNEPVPDWFHDAMLDGLQLLQVLQLQGTPSTETIGLTATVWIDAMFHGRPWVKPRDVLRLAVAFRSMAASVERWPAPRALLEHLPPVPEMAALPPPLLPRQRRAELVAKLHEVRLHLLDRSAKGLQPAEQPELDGLSE